MPRSAGNLELNQFTKGIVTEANPLNFPGDASLVDENLVLNLNGSRQRRLGLAYETGGTLTDLGITSATASTYAYSVHVWDNVNDDSSVGLSVVQVEDKLYFFDLFAAPMSGAPRNGGNPITIPSMKLGQVIQTASLSGKFVFVSGVKSVYYLEYDPVTDVVTLNSGFLKIRDMFGVDDSLDVDKRPTSLSTKHHYNIVNQGWGKDDPKGSEGRDYVELKNEAGFYPANSDIAYLGKDPTSTAGEFNGATFEAQYFGSTTAPRGRFIIDAFDRGVSRRTEFQKVIGSFLSLPADRSDTGLSTVAAAAGRIFYSGAGPSTIDGDENSPNIASFVFFTQTVEKTSQLFRCYQDADPSSEHITDLVATDGGFITIPEANRIFKLLSLGDGVLVFAENGVWFIHGGEVGFTATDFIVKKVTNVGIDSKRGVVDAEGQVFFWGKNGIYAIVTNEVTGLPTAQSLTEETIQTLYNDIPTPGRRNVIGAYDKAARSVRWLYNDETTYDGVSNKSNYNKELLFHTKLGAFTINKLDNTGSDRVADILATDGTVNNNLNVNVITSTGDNVVTSGALNVVVETNVQARGLSSNLYLVVNSAATEGITFGTYNDVGFQDWGTVDAKGILITGFTSMGDNQRNKDIKSLSMHFNRTETGYVLDENSNEEYDNPSSCLYRIRWNWSDSEGSGQWSDPEQAYIFDRLYVPNDVLDTFDYGYSVVTSKKTPPGSGKSFSIALETEEGKDMHLLGMSMLVTQEGKV